VRVYRKATDSESTVLERTKSKSNQIKSNRNSPDLMTDKK